MDNYGKFICMVRNAGTQIPDEEKMIGNIMEHVRETDRKSLPSRTWMSGIRMAAAGIAASLLVAAATASFFRSGKGTVPETDVSELSAICRNPDRNITENLHRLNTHTELYRTAAAGASKKYNHEKEKR